MTVPAGTIDRGGLMPQSPSPKGKAPSLEGGAKSPGGSE